MVRSSRIATVPYGHSRCHVRMHNHSTGRRLIQRRSVTPIVQKTHFIRARRLQGSHTFKEQFEFIRNPARRLATTASGYGPLRRKNLVLPKIASTIPSPEAMNERFPR